METLPSRIEGQARLNPLLMLEILSRPAFLSSFTLSKIKTLASTAIPTDKIKPAIPAKVRVTGISLKIAKTKIA